MSNKFVEDYATCAESRFVMNGDVHPTMQDIAEDYCGHKPAPAALVQDVWRQLPSIKAELESRGHLVTLVSLEHYQAQQAPKFEVDAYPHLPLGKRKSYGVYFASGPNDIVLTAAYHKGLVKAAGFASKAADRLINGHMAGQITRPDAQAMVKDYDNRSQPTTNGEELDKLRQPTPPEPPTIEGPK